MQEERQALDCAGISQAYRDFTIKSALNFMTGLKTVQDCCKVGITSFKRGATANVLWNMYQSILQDLLVGTC